MLLDITKNTEMDWQLVTGGVLALLVLDKVFTFIKAKGGGDAANIKLLISAVKEMTERHDDKWTEMVTQYANVETQHIRAIQSLTEAINKIEDRMDRMAAFSCPQADKAGRR